MTASLRRTTLGNGGLLLVSILLVSFLARPFPFRTFVVVVPPATLVLFLVLRRFLPTSLLPGRSLPKNAPRPSLAARVSECIVLSVAGVFVLLCFLQGIGLRRLDLATRADRVYLAALCAGLLLTAGTAWLAARGRGLISMLVLASGMMVGSKVVDHLVPRRWGSSQGGPEYLVFRLANGSELPAEVWVNGAYIGRSPAMISTEEFARRVPYPTSAPAKAAAEIEIPFYYPAGVSTFPRHQVLAVDLPTSDPSQWGAGRQKCYVQFRLNGEVGYGQYSGGGTWGSSRAVWTGSVDCWMTFPHVQLVLRDLLNQFRLNDYRATPEWYRAMDTYGRHGQKYLRDAAEKEPPLLAVWDDWARWHYGLSGVQDGTAAWRKLNEIQREADAEDWYFTADLSGRAVELLVPTLDAQQLTRHAIACIRSQNGSSTTWRTEYGRFQFGSGTGMGLASRVMKEPLAGHLTPGDFALAHAVWMKNEELRARGSVPNVIQEQVGTALVCWGNNTGLAGVLDWPGLDAYLLRQEWSAPMRRGEGRYLGNNHWLNEWLYQLAHRKSAAATAFRASHRRELTQMADILIENDFARSVPAFLFTDPASVPGSLAEEYWPSFRSRALRWTDRTGSLEQMWHYLVKMDPLSTPAMYVDCLHGADETWVGGAVEQLKALPLARRKIVVEALVADVQINIHQIKQVNPYLKNDERIRQIQRSIRSCLADREMDQSKEVLEGLAARKNRKFIATTGDWLEFEAPNHPVVEQLAGASDPAVRALVFRAVIGSPTPRNRQFREKLSNDPDATVRSEAERVRARLGSLASRPADELSLKISTP